MQSIISELINKYGNAPNAPRTSADAVAGPSGVAAGVAALNDNPFYVLGDGDGVALGARS